MMLAVLMAWSLLSALQGGAATRVAVVGFQHQTEVEDRVESAIENALSRDGSIELLDGSLVSAAVKGIGYDGSINMSREEARRLGAAIGCDFFIIGLVKTMMRSERALESHGEAIIAVMIVDGRSGRLALFDFIAERSRPDQGDPMRSALRAAVDQLGRRAAAYPAQLIRYRAEQAQPAQLEPAEEMPEEGSPRAENFAPPQFLNRVKPEYTREADLAGISATVEVMATLSADGRVVDVEVTRWAGFGLDQAAINAAHQLKFKPAMRDGNPISVRAMIRYNFRLLSR